MCSNPTAARRAENPKPKWVHQWGLNRCGSCSFFLRFWGPCSCPWGCVVLGRRLATGGAVLVSFGCRCLLAPPRVESYTWPGSNWRPSACEADVIATRPQVPYGNGGESFVLMLFCWGRCLKNNQPLQAPPSANACLFLLAPQRVLANPRAPTHAYLFVNMRLHALLPVATACV